MAPNRDRDSSPTGMLWAHQLKREHGFLLDRMKKLEAEIGKVESTAKTAKNASANQDIAAIAQKVKALTEDETTTAAESIRKEVMDRLERVHAEMEAITAKVAGLDQNYGEMEDDRKQAFNNEKTLIKRVKEVEEHLARYEKNQSQVGNPVNQDQMDVIRKQLGSLLDQVREESEQQDTFKDSLEALDSAMKEVKADNERLTKEIKALGDRPPPILAPQQPVLNSGRVARPSADTTANAANGPVPTATSQVSQRSKGTACAACRKAHRRCGHGTMETQTNEDADEDGDEPTLNNAAQSAAFADDSETEEAEPLRPTRKAPARGVGSSNIIAVKKEMVEAREQKPQVKSAAARGLQRELRGLQAASRPTKKEPQTERPTENRIIATGRGWIQVERTPSDPQEAATPASSQKGTTAAERVKRGRGRPRKIVSQEQTQTQTQAVVPKRGRGRPRKDSSQAATQTQLQTQTPKRGRGRPRKNAAPASAPAPAPVKVPKVDPPKRGRGRPRKESNESTTVDPPAPVRKRVIKQEPEKSQAQPLRQAKAVPTIETKAAPTAFKPTFPNLTRTRGIQEEADSEIQEPSLPMLKKMPGSKRPDLYAIASSPLSAPPSSPLMKDKGKRKAVEEPVQSPPKRRMIKQENDKENQRLRKMWSTGVYK